MNKIAIGTIVVIILGIVSGASFWFLNLDKKIELAYYRIDTTDWQTYRTEEFGFELKYPSNWVIIEPNEQEKSYGEIISFETTNTETLIDQKKVSPLYRHNLIIDAEPIISGSLAIPQDLILEYHEASGNVWKGQFFDEISRAKIGSILVNGIDAYEYYEIGYGSAYAILLNNNKEFYSLFFGRTGSRDLLPETERAVLSTFKFIK